MDDARQLRRRRLRGLALSLLLTLAAVAAVAPAPARAALDLNAAVRTAKAVFPAVTQRCGLVGIEIGPLSLLNLGASAESFRIGCRVRVAPQTMTAATQAQLCSLMVHEWGHLAGLEHSPDPNNFMSPLVPHNQVCGPSDQELRAQDLAAGVRAARAEEVREKIADLRGSLRATRRAQRRARAAKRARLARKAKRLEKRIRRLRVELRSL